MTDFVMLAKVFEPLKHKVPGWFCSTKLDGMRAFWDGGISRGKPAQDIPWAHLIEKDNRTATGLWSRLGKPIAAPNYFLDALPRFPLDGELWFGNGKFQDLVSITKKYIPNESDWRKVQYRVFDSPHPLQIGLPNDSKLYDYAIRLRNYEEILELLESRAGPYYLKQYKLPSKDYLPFLEQLLTMTVSEGGEGLMLRHPVALWVPKRSVNLLKYKPFSDDEATVVGYTWGEGKYEGMLGALIVQWNDKEFELSGMTDLERNLDHPFIASSPTPKTRIQLEPLHIKSPSFPIGQRITFRYRTLTDGGIPREARYLRKM